MNNSTSQKRNSGYSVKFPNESTKSPNHDARTKQILLPQSRPTLFNLEPLNDSPVQNRRHVNNPTPESMNIRNVVIFGDSGVGKSSLINMLSGCKIAETSNGVLGCTFQSRRYTILVKEEQVNVWDTAGLDEGTRGRVPPEVAEKNLTKLLRELRAANGIHLLVYCIRGPSVRRSLARNYTIFYSAICRKKVPVVAVVTGLENEPDSMEDWWTRNEKELARYKMRFDAHACVTTIDMDKSAGSVFETRSRESQQSVRNLIVDHSRSTISQPFSDTNIFIKAALLDFRSMIKSGWENQVQPTSNVVFYGTHPLLLPLGFFGDVKRVSSLINNRNFIFHNAGDLSQRYITPRMSRGAADLLIFIGSMTKSNLDKLQKFHSSCSGEICPLLVVTDDRSINEWKTQLDALGICAQVASMPSASEGGFAEPDLWSLIDDLCLVRGPAKYRQAKFLKFFLRKSKEYAGGDSELEVVTRQN